MPPAARLLMIDDNVEFRDFVVRVARFSGYEPDVTGDPVAFRELVAARKPDVILVDLHLGITDGIEILRDLSRLGSRAKVLVISGADHRVLQTAEQLGRERNLDMAGVLEKPVRATHLKQVLESLRPKAPIVSEDSLAAAIAGDELALHYQPRLNLKQNSFVSVEALVRWHHPTAGMIPPMDFVPFAEETGLIRPLTEWVFQRAIRDCGAWHKDGLALGVAVNVSALNITTINLPDRLAELCREHGVATESVTVELTETAATGDTAGLMDVLARFRLKGFQLAIDDFGTGYSSLIQLLRLPFSEIKVDKSFVLSMLKVRESALIVKTVIDLAHNLSLTATAEGVEDDATLQQLSLLGCDFAQGFGLCRPQPLDQMIESVKAWNSAQAAGQRLLS